MFIPGMFPGASEAGLTTLAVVSTTQNAGGSITIPTVQDGDLLILQTWAWDGSSSSCTFSAVSGWITITDISTAVKLTWASLHFKLATAADTGAVITGGAAAPGGALRLQYKSLLVVRGDAPITAAVAGGINAEKTTGNPAAQTVPISGSVAPLFVIGSYATVGASGVAISARELSIGGVDVKDGEYQEAASGNSNDIWIAWKSFNANDSLATDAVVDMGTFGTSSLMSCYLACS